MIYKRGAIYKIPCKDCSGVYIDEMGRCFNQGVEPDPNRIRKPVLTVIIF